MKARPFTAPKVSFPNQFPGILSGKQAIEKCKTLNLELLSGDISSPEFFRALISMKIDTNELAMAIISSLLVFLIHCRPYHSAFVAQFTELFSAIMQYEDEIVRRSTLSAIYIISTTSVLSKVFKTLTSRFSTWTPGAKELFLSFAFSLQAPSVLEYLIFVPFAELETSSDDENLSSTAIDFLAYMSYVSGTEKVEPRIRNSIDFSKDQLRKSIDVRTSMRMSTQLRESLVSNSLRESIKSAKMVKPVHEESAIEFRLLRDSVESSRLPIMEESTEMIDHSQWAYEEEDQYEPRESISTMRPVLIASPPSLRASNSSLRMRDSVGRSTPETGSRMSQSRSSVRSERDSQPLNSSDLRESTTKTPRKSPARVEESLTPVKSTPVLRESTRDLRNSNIMSKSNEAFGEINVESYLREIANNIHLGDMMDDTTELDMTADISSSLRRSHNLRASQDELESTNDMSMSMRRSSPRIGRDTEGARRSQVIRSPRAHIDDENLESTDKIRASQRKSVTMRSNCESIINDDASFIGRKSTEALDESEQMRSVSIRKSPTLRASRSDDLESTNEHSFAAQRKSISARRSHKSPAKNDPVIDQRKSISARRNQTSRSYETPDVVDEEEDSDVSESGLFGGDPKPVISSHIVMEDLDLGLEVGEEEQEEEEPEPEPVQSYRATPTKSPRASDKTSLTVPPTRPARTGTDYVAMMKDPEWSNQQKAVDRIRRTLDMNPISISGQCKDILTNLMDLVVSPRTMLANAALGLAGDLFAMFSQQLSANAAAFTTVCLNVVCNTHQFIADSAERVIKLIAQKTTRSKVFASFIAGTKHKNTIARGKSAECLGLLIAQSRLDDKEFTSVVQHLAPLLRDNRSETRESAKATLGKITSDKRFENVAVTAVKNSQDYKELMSLIE